MVSEQQVNVAEEAPEVSGTQIVKATNEWLHPLEPYGPAKALKEMTRRIMLFDTGKIKMNATEAGHLAQVAASAWLNPFTGEIWGWVTIYRDKRKLSIMPGRKGLIRHAKEQSTAEGDKFWPEYKKVVNLDARRSYGLEQGDLAYECQLRSKMAIDVWNESLKAAAAAELPPADIKEMIGPRPYTFGLGVLRAKEIADLDKRSDNRMTHTERCQKRAYMMALKQAYVLPLASAIGDAGQTMEDFVPEAEWREVGSEPPELEAGEDPAEEPTEDLAPELIDPAELDGEPEFQTTIDPAEARKPLETNQTIVAAEDRPYTPEVVREKVRERSATFKNVRKTSKIGDMELWQYVAWQLAEAFRGDDDSDAKRHAVLAYLWGKTSSKDLTGAECQATIQWLNPGEYDGPGAGLYPMQVAQTEARQILEARLLELGQQRLMELEE